VRCCQRVAAITFKSEPPAVAGGQSTYQGAQSLILGRRRNVLLHGKIVQELLHFGRAHFRGVTFMMKENVALDPIYVGGFRSRLEWFRF
jgi:hypothetical protein